MLRAIFKNKYDIQIFCTITSPLISTTTINTSDFRYLTKDLLN